MKKTLLKASLKALGAFGVITDEIRRSELIALGKPNGAARLVA